jgi:hypothetical protein
MIQLTSNELELTFEPDQGGKWRSLRDRRTGREWLWSNPHQPVSPIGYSDSFIAKHDTGGWDEIFPSVSPCGAIPDHGDLVRLPWSVDLHNDTRLTMSLEGRCLPFRFERTVILNGANIRCEYRLKNIGDQAFPWLWCAHPLLPLTPDITFKSDAAFTVPMALAAAQHLTGTTIQLDELPWGEKTWAAKLFSERGAVDEFTAQHADGSALRFKWNTDETPYLGLWINHGAWSGCDSKPYFNIGIEPSTLPLDDLSQATQPPTLPPGCAATWSLEVSLT